MATFIIKNVRNHPVKVGPVVIMQPGEQLTAHELIDDIADAFRRGDISITNATLKPHELKADVDAIEDGINKMSKILNNEV